MTRKDYILIMSALRIPYNSFSKNPLYGRELNGVGAAAIAAADVLEQDNPKFDREHFLAVIRGEKDIDSKPDRSLGIKLGTTEAEMFRHERNSQMGEAVREYLNPKTVHRYQLTLRPFSFCNVPKGYIPGSAKDLQIRAGNYGSIAYPDKLAADVVEHFDLKYLGEEPAE